MDNLIRYFNTRLVNLRTRVDNLLRYFHARLDGLRYLHIWLYDLLRDIFTRKGENLSKRLCHQFRID
jgi:hypothetical protein